jgi:hypothetical protein
MGLDVRSKVSTPAFVARTSSWGETHSQAYRNRISPDISMARPVYHVHR